MHQGDNKNCNVKWVDEWAKGVYRWWRERPPILTSFMDLYNFIKKDTPIYYCLESISPLFLLPLILIENTQNKNNFIIDQIRDRVTFMD